MRISLLFTSLLFYSYAMVAQLNYAVSAIPKQLLVKAGAIVRLDETDIRINGLSDVSRTEKYAITILNESAADEAEMAFYYDKTEHIKSVKAIIYNEFGFPVSKIAEKDFVDRSRINDFSLYEDNRVKYFNPAIKSYPYTLEYEIEYKTRQTLLLPRWTPVRSESVAVEKSHLKVTYPADFELRHQETNFPGAVVAGTENSAKTLQWELNNFAAIRAEPYSPPYEKVIPMVKLAPLNFAYNNLKGSFSNWLEYGKWMSESLLKGRDLVSDQTRQAVIELTANASSEKEKAKLVYQFVQNKTRYISVQIGIGGYRPFPASDVDQFGYGDCKGLVNYTRSLLKIAGVESYYCVVNAGSVKRDMDSNFASLNQGNHIILCLPFKNDTTWLECTDKFAPFGFLGDFTDDRIVLACTPDGGKLLRTPKMTTQENAQIRVSEFNVDASGAATGKIITKFSGSQYDNHDLLFNEPKDEQLKKVAELYPQLSFQASALDYTKIKEGKPLTIETLSFSSSNYGTINDQKLHVPLNKINLFQSAPKEVRNRQNAVYINRSFYDEDLTTFNLPEGYKALASTEKKLIEKPFGKYTVEVNYSGNKIVYKRTMQMNEGTYKPEIYEELVDFYQQIMEFDNSTIALSK